MHQLALVGRIHLVGGNGDDQAGAFLQGFVLLNRAAFIPEQQGKRDDKKYLKHSLAYRSKSGPPKIKYLDVVITRSPPGVRDYSGAKP